VITNFASHFHGPAFGKKEYKEFMKPLIQTMTALDFKSSTNPYQATGDKDTTPSIVKLYPNLMKIRLPTHRAAALQHFKEAAHNAGRDPTKPTLLNWSHVNNLAPYVQKSILKVHTHTRETQNVHCRDEQQDPNITIPIGAIARRVLQQAFPIEQRHVQ
jgi:hypothetical protein